MDTPELSSIHHSGSGISLPTKLRCAIGDHTIAKADQKRLRDSSEHRIITNCTACNARVVIRIHPVATNSYTIGEL